MKNELVKIDLLYFDGCPSYKTAWNDLLEVITEHGFNATVQPVQIDTLEKAEMLHFAGSPTVKVNGRDLEDYLRMGVMACRRYEENGGKGWPSKELLTKRLMEAANL